MANGGISLNRTRMNLLAGTAVLCLVCAPVSAQEHSYHIPAEPLSKALRDFGQESGKQIIFTEELVRGKSAPEIKGVYTADEVLKRILAQSGLRTETTRTGAIMVMRSQVTDIPDTTIAAPATSVLADDLTPTEDIVVTGTVLRGVVPVGSNLTTITRKAIDDSGRSTVQEVIRASPLNFAGGPTEQMDGRSGLDSPNYASGASVNLRGLGSDANLVLIDGRRLAPSGNGSFVDVADIPLSAVDHIEILADGASATYGSDAISGVVNVFLRRKFDGIESHAKVSFADGGYREYYADQVAGFTWANGSLLAGIQYAHQDSLNSNERALTATADLRRWGGTDFRSLLASPGNIISPTGLAGAIPSGQDGRSLTAAQILVGQQNLNSTSQGSDVLPNRNRYSGFLSLKNDFSDRLHLSADVIATLSRTSFLNDADSEVLTVPVTNAYSQMNGLGLPGTDPITMDYSFINDLGNPVVRGRGTMVAGGASLEYDVTSKWHLTTSVSGGLNRTSTAQSLVDTRSAGGLELALASSDPATAFNPFGDGGDNSAAVLRAITDDYHGMAKSTFWSAGLMLDGELPTVLGVTPKASIGVEHRHDLYESDEVDTYRIGAPKETVEAGGRNVDALYGELLLPFVTQDTARPGIADLSLSLAGRVDRYSDFGTTVNPKVGLGWSPVPSVRLSGTFGTSYKAPRLADLKSPFIVQYIALPTAFGAADHDGDGLVETMALSGGSPHLKPEHAKTWTAGAEWTPTFVPGLSLKGTYYRVSIRDRIAQVTDLRGIFGNPIYYEGSIFFGNPTLAQAQALAQGAARVVGAPFTSALDAIVDRRTVNTATVFTDGVDLEASYHRSVGTGTLSASISGTYVFRYATRQTPTSPEFTAVGIVGRPVDFKSRASLGWDGGAFGATLSANYTDNYRNQLVEPNQKIAASTTFDLQGRFDIGRLWDEREKGRTVLRLSAINLFNRSPPFVNGGGYAYDGSNYSVLGRLVSIDLTTRW